MFVWKKCNFAAENTCNTPKTAFFTYFLTVSLKLYPYEKTSVINLHILQQTFLEPIIDQMTRCHLNSFICLTKLAAKKAQEFIADLKQHC